MYKKIDFKQFVQNIKLGADGRWPQVLGQLGINVNENSKHGPCPGCGGKDRFIWKTGRQTYYCSGGGDEPSYGDGISLVMHVKKCSFKDAINELAKALSIKIASPPTMEKGDNYYRGKRWFMFPEIREAVLALKMVKFIEQSGNSLSSEEIIVKTEKKLIIDAFSAVGGILDD